mmetsp:Transcript_12438/g.30406  ORF Transcript_12438/g.30406 Transcript_12438/m.30406 type:complete len:234 (+) Transcript_12438:3736-4437(+)
MFTTHVHKLAAAADFDAIFSGVKLASSIYGLRSPTSCSVMSSPLNSESFPLNASTFCIICLARFQVNFFALYSFSMRMRHAFVTLSTPAGGLPKFLSSESIALLKQSTAAAAASIAGFASPNSFSASFSIVMAFSDSSFAFSASNWAASSWTWASACWTLISSMSLSVATFFSPTFSIVIFKSFCNSVTSCDVFRSVDRPTSKRSMRRCNSACLFPSRYLKKEMSSKNDLGVT